ncbi:hypothetical protein, partial [Klebsiella pneumoniae]|uniref:hypothetical protein n=1 Tax=Klebsiella pneumoniae TaxID=573 RepID=UPI00272FA457
ECDIAVESVDDADVELRASIIGLRRRLLGEHLDVTEEEVDDALSEQSLLSTVRALSTSDARSLRVDTGWCGHCSRPRPSKKPPRVCVACGV